MKVRVKRVVACLMQGVRSSPRYGDHPGTIPLLVLLGCGAAAGGWVGIAVMLILCGPVYLYGAYERGELMAIEDRED